MHICICICAWPGIYRALHLSGAIADMERRGVESVRALAYEFPCDVFLHVRMRARMSIRIYVCGRLPIRVQVHAFAVDNAVCRVADPVFMGYCLARGAEVGNKVCACRARTGIVVCRMARI